MPEDFIRPIPKTKKFYGLKQMKNGFSSSHIKGHIEPGKIMQWTKILAYPLVRTHVVSWAFQRGMVIFRRMITDISSGFLPMRKMAPGGLQPIFVLTITTTKHGMLI